MRLGVTWYQVAYNLIITTVIDIRGKITSYKKVWTKVIMNQFQNLCTEPIIQSIWTGRNACKNKTLMMGTRVRY